MVDATPAPVPAAVLTDLRVRLEHYRPIAANPDPDWVLGTPRSYLEEVLDAWRTTYDWRLAEDRVRRLPWVVAGDPDTPVRLVDQRTSRDDAPVVVLLHGWPDSVLRFERVLPLLTDVHVIAPALPGFPFAAPTRRPVPSAVAMADAIAAAVADLGHHRYVVSGGDVGTDVAEAMAARHPDSVVGVHFTDLSHRHVLSEELGDLTDEETEYADAVTAWHRDEGGYNHQQSTRPESLAVGLGDSPAGLAAWILEKLHVWSDRESPVGSAFTTTQALDWITAYWVTGSIGTSFSPYAHREEPGTVTAPTAFTVFPRDIVVSPRSLAERFFDVRSWTIDEAGGHFDAWERPHAYADGVRRILAEARSSM
jgi:pimeloyl-ACP methyl ester carboxylesterase